MRSLTTLVFSALLSVCCSAQIVSVRGSGHVTNGATPEPPGKSVSSVDVLTNRDIIEMVSMGLPDDIIEQKIRIAPASKFDLSVTGLKSLKNGKVSDPVIRTMLSPKAPGGPTSSSGVALTTRAEEPNNVSVPPSVGVYFLRKGEYVEIEPEVVGWKTGGVLKNTVTLGIDKQHINGKVMGPHSPTRLNNPVEIVIRTVEGTSATEYQLLRLYEKVNRREFRSVTGGVLHATGDAERTRLPMKPEKIADRTWRVTLDKLSAGEYGLLPPGISSASIGASGKIYSFAIVE
jgi:hypothetical protein